MSNMSEDADNSILPSAAKCTSANVILFAECAELMIGALYFPLGLFSYQAPIVDYAFVGVTHLPEFSMIHYLMCFSPSLVLHLALL